MSRKQPLPAVAGDDLDAVLLRRRQRSSAPEARGKAAPVTDVEMDRRSWYMRKDTADTLADLVTELHFSTRLPRHVILAAIVEHAQGNLEQVREQLGKAQA